MSHVADETPLEIASTSVVGVSTHAARADHTHGGFDPANRIMAGLYAYRIDDSAQAPGDGNTTWIVRINAGRAVIAGQTKFLTLQSVTLHSGSKLLDPGEECAGAIFGLLINGVASFGSLKSAPGVTSTPPTDEEITAFVGNPGWVRITNTVISRGEDEVETPAAHASVQVDVDVGLSFGFRATATGPDGNNIRLKALANAPTADVIITRDGTDFTIRYKEGESTVVGLIEALDALSGDDDIIGWPGEGDPDYIPEEQPVIYLEALFAESLPEWTSLTGGEDEVIAATLDATYDNDAADTGSV